MIRYQDKLEIVKSGFTYKRIYAWIHRSPVEF